MFLQYSSLGKESEEQCEIDPQLLNMMNLRKVRKPRSANNEEYDFATGAIFDTGWAWSCKKIILCNRNWIMFVQWWDPWRLWLLSSCGWDNELWEKERWWGVQKFKSKLMPYWNPWDYSFSFSSYLMARLKRKKSSLKTQRRQSIKEMHSVAFNFCAKWVWLSMKLHSSRLEAGWLRTPSAQSELV